ncbi:phosphopantetheine-binding protein [Thiocystis minor]|uniref:phosphopantetheine-binding protein n=1 Tax=Thiocystis minor TaxID=61597 RepID=UPI0019137C17|nr:phosphopantetheine-binding protein [Thiocystis minor]
MTQNIESRLIDIIAKEAQIERDWLKPESTMDDFGVPSITQLEVLFAIEESFGIELPDKPVDLTLAGLVRQVASMVEPGKDA